MFKKILTILYRDMKSSTRDFMVTYIMAAPVLLAVVITLFAPGLNESTISLAMMRDDDAGHIEYMEQFARVEVFDSVEEMEKRVAGRDDTAALIPADNGEYEILLQGNESELVENYTRMLSALYQADATKEDSTAQMMSFGHTVPPLKTMLVNMLISVTVMLAGMLIAVSIVEEKADNTISAINVSPISQTGFVVGKTLFGGLVAMMGIVIALFITGYSDINWLMIILVGLSSMILALIIGFLQGLSSSDLIEAAGNVKMVMLPIAGSIAGYELLADNWQWTMYWSPFYWAYKANMMILSKTADWPTVLLCTGMVTVLSMAVYFISVPAIRKGLS